MSIANIFTSPLTARSEKSADLPIQLRHLFEKMGQIASIADVQMSKNIFKVMQNEKMKHNVRQDPITKLKNLENRSEMNRASVELMSQRKPKSYSSRARKNQNKKDENNYLKIYQQLKEQQSFQELINLQENSDEQSDNHVKGPEGIKHYRYLRQHPKLLTFAIDKKKSKDQFLKIQSKKQEQQIIFKKLSDPSQMNVNTNNWDLIDDSKNIQCAILNSSDSLIDNQLSKFYSKNTKGKIDIKVKQNPRCSQIMRRQDKIISIAQQRNISKQNMKKLKDKMNQIVNELYKNDKKGSVFPRISTNVSHNNDNLNQ